MLQVDELHVDFGGVKAVAGVSFELQDGGTLGVIGPNGSGKTTLLNALTGVVKATGSVYVDGRPLPLRRPARISRSGISRVFQAPQTFSSLTCLENVLIGSADRRYAGYVGALVARPAMIRRERERWTAGTELLEQVGLHDMATATADSLTYGQRRLLELARALAARPRILLLDEPSAGLNDAESDSLAALVERTNAAGVSIVIVDHKLDFVERLCPRLMVMDFGHVIAEGSPDVVWSDPRVVEAYLGVNDA